MPWIDENGEEHEGKHPRLIAREILARDFGEDEYPLYHTDPPRPEIVAPDEVDSGEEDED